MVMFVAGSNIGLHNLIGIKRVAPHSCYDNDQSVAIRTQDTYLQNVREILKRFIQNFKKILKKYSLCTKST